MNIVSANPANERSIGVVVCVCVSSRWVLLVAQMLACALCIAGVVTAGRSSTGGGSAAITDAVSGDYNLCNYMPGYPVTTETTQYYCHSFAFPDLDQQVIKYRPLVDQSKVGSLFVRGGGGWMAVVVVRKRKRQPALAMGFCWSMCAPIQAIVHPLRPPSLPSTLSHTHTHTHMHTHACRCSTT